MTKQFGNVIAVNDFSLDVADGELLVLLGPSGCGKSTILRLISGLDNPSHGEILIGERQVERLSPKDRDVAMVFQNYALYPHMSVYDNMAFGLKMRRTPSQEIERRVRESAVLLDITRLLQRKPGQLSGGERQRVALARAIVREPRVFLMDEPLSNLDAQLRVQTRAEIVKLQRRLKATVIYVTHDQTEAMTMADRVAVMRGGVLQQVAPPQQLYDLPANRFVGGFIGNPGMNFLTARVGTLDGELCLTTSLGRYSLLCDPGATVPPADSEMVIGVRPEDVILTPRRESAAEAPPATVELVEPLGSEKLVHLVAGNDRLVARVDPRASISAEDKVQIQLKAERSHLFDASTGLRMEGLHIASATQPVQHGASVP